MERLKQVEEKVEAFVDSIGEGVLLAGKTAKRLEELQDFLKYLKLHEDLIERRLIKGEVIPHEEKMFSLFEPHTEWIAKGKTRPNVELGHRLLITTNQRGRIVDYKVMENTVDSQEVFALIDRLKVMYGEAGVCSHSFDKGFYSAENKAKVSELATMVVMPKKGKLTQEEKETQKEKKWKVQRHAHSAVESDINSLEHHGLDRCPDKGLEHYKRYVGLGVLAYNLHKVGNTLQRGKRVKAQAA